MSTFNFSGGKGGVIYRILYTFTCDFVEDLGTVLVHMHTSGYQNTAHANYLGFIEPQLHTFCGIQYCTVVITEIRKLQILKTPSDLQIQRQGFQTFA